MCYELSLGLQVFQLRFCLQLNINRRLLTATNCITATSVEEQHDGPLTSPSLQAGDQDGSENVRSLQVVSYATQTRPPLGLDVLVSTKTQ